MDDYARELQVLKKLFSCSASALYCEGDDAACSLREVLLSELVVLVSFEARVVYPVDLRMVFEELREREGVVGVASHADVQMLQSLESKPRVHRSDAASEVSEGADPDLHREGCGAEFFIEVQAVIAFIRLCDLGIFVVLLPVEFSGVDDDAAHGCRLTVSPLRRCVDDDVSAVLDRTAQEGRCQRVVDDEGNADLFCSRRELFKVQDVQSRVRDRFTEQQPRLGTGSGNDLFEARILIDECDIDAESLERHVEQVECSSVDARACEDVISSLAERADRKEDGSHA